MWPHPAFAQEGPGEGACIVVCRCHLPEMGCGWGRGQTAICQVSLSWYPLFWGPSKEPTSHCCLLVPSPATPIL